MPKPLKLRTKPRKGETGIEVARAEWRDYLSPLAWSVSRSGNLWRKWNGMAVVVFYRNGEHHWLIAHDEFGRRFSSQGYRTAEQAQRALGDALQIG